MTKGQRVEVFAGWLNRYVPATVLRTFEGTVSESLVEVRFDGGRSIQMIPIRIVKEN